MEGGAAGWEHVPRVPSPAMAAGGGRAAVVPHGLEALCDARRHRERGRASAPRGKAREDLHDALAPPGLSLPEVLHIRRGGAAGGGVALPAHERGVGAGGDWGEEGGGVGVVGGGVLSRRWIGASAPVERGSRRAGRCFQSSRCTALKRIDMTCHASFCPMVGRCTFSQEQPEGCAKQPPCRCRCALKLASVTAT